MFLDKIVATKRLEVEAMQNFSIAEAEKEIAQLPPCLGFERSLSSGRNRAMGLIAEVKKASPSKGLIRPDFEPVELAKSYAAAGTDCISVLTDVDYFQGSNAYLQAVRQAVSVPLLRKDFTIDPKQIYEARLLGADAILLIAAILTTEQMKAYLALARDLGMDALVEVHDREELERALELNTTFIGINNRNLKTFVTDLATTEELTQLIPEGVTVVSESGISSVEDLAFVQKAGAKAVLIGEHFMRQPVVGDAIEALMGPRVNAAK
ncbi:indole-3-glycerol phosphate synthase TrpC [Paenibacillus whitsoniae]|uniref:Indole-3-glycerol phosphate synthase n=1 Tax=Paenibacillus whitsoniae TaxID=2496558 RepID=A0A3S0IDD9_9BACL|nr:indole-3-glycerol phosphate synthase TrpC [Paenibacillus whitsoniae]RTE10451.1 indole-3-glycerol phosphate synthase TrpC [Paenibacillus whitsoniae]